MGMDTEYTQDTPQGVPLDSLRCGDTFELVISGCGIYCVMDSRRVNAPLEGHVYCVRLDRDYLRQMSKGTRVHRRKVKIVVFPK